MARGKLNKKKCKICFKIFRPKVYWQEFCSKKCREINANEEKKLRRIKNIRKELDKAVEIFKEVIK